MPFLTRSQLRVLFDDSCFFPSKDNGQNYLVDTRFCDRIVHELKLDSEDQVLEIGSGFGAFTDEIVSHTQRTYLIEREPISVQFLSQTFASRYPTVHLKAKSQINWSRVQPDSRVIILESDALRLSFPSTNKLISSVPYRIVFPLIMKIIHSWTYECVILIIQKEVATRLVAAAGKPGYNVLAAFTGFYTQSQILTEIPKTSFYPEPEVESVLVKISPRSTILSPAPERGLRSEYELFLRGLFREMTWNLRRGIHEMQTKKLQIFNQFPFLMQNAKDSAWYDTPLREIPTEALFQIMQASLPRKYRL